ncbi:MAG: molybdopterin oxidoreductase [Proteobacteria bacterium]|nr:MAG: molybdopterin oxidoreductase [Pseudomonadota bacterium]QKK12288.1 MAG: polysulfide reductase NrfD [Pseudomonadota bacterium]
MSITKFRTIEGRSPGYLALLGALGALLLAGLGSAWYMEHNGHYVTGMSNQIVWGMPHVFAVFLIVAASGALNAASIGSVFGKLEYKPLAPLSALLAMALLAGGLAVLVLDLGRPDRLIVAMTTYNFKSIFAWNIFLYVGFLAIVAVYLWWMMERRMYRYHRIAGFVAFIWRLTLTTGTGSIFGFLVAREAYDAAVMAPLFIAMSLSFGLAIFILVLDFSCQRTHLPINHEMLQRLARLLAIFIAAVLYFTAVQHLTNLYAAEHQNVEHFILFSGNKYSQLFWIGQVLFGGFIPLLILLHPDYRATRAWVTIASVLVIIGGLCQIYVIIIGGQAYPLEMFPGKEVSSGFFDGEVSTYSATLPEFLLGLGGVALSLLILSLAVRVLPLLPQCLEPPRPAGEETPAS